MNKQKSEASNERQPCMGIKLILTYVSTHNAEKRRKKVFNRAINSLKKYLEREKMVKSNNLITCK